MAAGTQPDVRIQRNVLVPLDDGVSLAADLFLPEAPGRYPVLVSYYPYHKDDLIGALFDHPNRYFADHGYASLLVDLRGLGGSDGEAWDVGDQREATDGAQIVEWASAQPWCDGSVGMWGMSYGGITSLKTAAERPPHLRAIVPMCAGLDHYHDIVYPGGCFNMLGILGGWGPFMTTMNLAPPMFRDTAGRWSRVWQERLERAREPYIMPYLDHPARDQHWQSKAIAAERIDVPTFLIGAWRDIFPEAMVRAFERIPAPRRLLMGPWMHEMPDLAREWKVDYLAEMTRWWDRWLKGAENGVSEEPPVTIFVQGSGWRNEAAWPVARTVARTVFLDASEPNGGSLEPSAPVTAHEVVYRADPTVGACAGLWDPTGAGLGYPIDQGPDDLRSISFTGAPLEADLEITGSPESLVHLALDEGEELNLVVKLCDVSPDGRSTLITTGWLRGTHRISHEEPSPIPVGQTLEYRVPLWATSYRVPAGHRLRVSIACADFPRIWPTRTNPLVRVATGHVTPSAVTLPVITPAGTPVRELPVPDPGINRTPLDIEGTPRWTIQQDHGTGSVTVTTGIRSATLPVNRLGRLLLDRTGRAQVTADRPDTASVIGEARLEIQAPGVSSVVIDGQLRVTLTDQQFTGRVTVDGQVIFEQHWGRNAPGSG
jgi:putative CocE/NonD family hydrolase